jgi:DNA-binding NarL/FixJ family response regulator
LINQETPKKIMVVDDHVLFCEGLISLFRFSNEYLVVGSAGSVQEAVSKARETRPDIILMDFSLPDGTGLDATKIILAEQPECKIVFLTVYETDENLFAAIRLGAKGYMLKNVAGSDLISSLRALDRGESAISRKMMNRVLEEFVNTPADSAGGDLISKLSPREKDILRELESGATNTDIAQRLFLSENTVKHHIRNVFDKLGIENRRQAAELARQFGLKSDRPVPKKS